MYSSGDFAFIYGEGLKNYTGPHLLASADGKCARLQIGESTEPRYFNISQLGPAPIQRHPSCDEQLSRLGDGLGKVLHTEVVGPGDSRAFVFNDVKRNEILGAIERGTLRLVFQDEADQNPNIVPSAYLLAMKQGDDGRIVYKARLVLGGHRDRDEKDIAHHLYNLKQSFVRSNSGSGYNFGI